MLTPRVDHKKDGSKSRFSFRLKITRRSILITREQDVGTDLHNKAMELKES